MALCRWFDEPYRMSLLLNSTPNSVSIQTLLQALLVLRHFRTDFSERYSGHKWYFALKSFS